MAKAKTTLDVRCATITAVVGFLVVLCAVLAGQEVMHKLHPDGGPGQKIPEGGPGPKITSEGSPSATTIVGTFDLNIDASDLKNDHLLLESIRLGFSNAVKISTRETLTLTDVGVTKLTKMRRLASGTTVGYRISTPDSDTAARVSSNIKTTTAADVTSSIQSQIPDGHPQKKNVAVLRIHTTTIIATATTTSPKPASAEDNTGYGTATAWTCNCPEANKVNGKWPPLPNFLYTCDIDGKPSGENFCCVKINSAYSVSECGDGERPCNNVDSCKDCWINNYDYCSSYKKYCSNKAISNPCKQTCKTQYCTPQPTTAPTNYPTPLPLCSTPSSGDIQSFFGGVQIGKMPVPADSPLRCFCATNQLSEDGSIACCDQFLDNSKDCVLNGDGPCKCASISIETSCVIRGNAYSVHQQTITTIQSNYPSLKCPPPPTTFPTAFPTTSPTPAPPLGKTNSPTKPPTKSPPTKPPTKNVGLRIPCPSPCFSPGNQIITNWWDTTNKTKGQGCCHKFFELGKPCPLNGPEDACMCANVRPVLNTKAYRVAASQPCQVPSEDVYCEQECWNPANQISIDGSDGATPQNECSPSGSSKDNSLCKQGVIKGSKGALWKEGKGGEREEYCDQYLPGHWLHYRCNPKDPQYGDALNECKATCVSNCCEKEYFGGPGGTLGLKCQLGSSKKCKCVIPKKKSTGQQTSCTIPVNTGADPYWTSVCGTFYQKACYDVCNENSTWTCPEYCMDASLGTLPNDKASCKTTGLHAGVCCSLAKLPNHYGDKNCCCDSSYDPSNQLYCPAENAKSVRAAKGNDDVNSVFSCYGRRGETCQVTTANGKISPVTQCKNPFGHACEIGSVKHTQDVTGEPSLFQAKKKRQDAALSRVLDECTAECYTLTVFKQCQQVATKQSRFLTSYLSRGVNNNIFPCFINVNGQDSRTAVQPLPYVQSRCSLSKCVIRAFPECQDMAKDGVNQSMIDDSCNIFECCANQVSPNNQNNPRPSGIAPQKCYVNTENYDYTYLNSNSNYEQQYELISNPCHCKHLKFGCTIPMKNFSEHVIPTPAPTKYYPPIISMPPYPPLAGLQTVNEVCNITNKSYSKSVCCKTENAYIHYNNLTGTSVHRANLDAPLHLWTNQTSNATWQHRDCTGADPLTPSDESRPGFGAAIVSSLSDPKVACIGKDTWIQVAMSVLPMVLTDYLLEQISQKITGCNPDAALTMWEKVTKLMKEWAIKIAEQVAVTGVMCAIAMEVDGIKHCVSEGKAHTKGDLTRCMEVLFGPGYVGALAVAWKTKKFFAPGDETSQGKTLAIVGSDGNTDEVLDPSALTDATKLNGEGEGGKGAELLKAIGGAGGEILKGAIAITTCQLIKMGVAKTRDGKKCFDSDTTAGMICSSSTQAFCGEVVQFLENQLQQLVTKGKNECEDDKKQSEEEEEAREDEVQAESTAEATEEEYEGNLAADDAVTVTPEGTDPLTPDDQAELNEAEKQLETEEKQAKEERLKAEKEKEEREEEEEKERVAELDRENAKIKKAVEDAENKADRAKAEADRARAEGTNTDEPGGEDGGDPDIHFDPVDVRRLSEDGRRLLDKYRADPRLFPRQLIENGYLTEASLRTIEIQWKEAFRKQME